MIEQDTIKLLRECDAGVSMGVEAIDEVLPSVHAAQLKDLLCHCRGEHESLRREIRQRLERCRDEGKDPSLMAKGMSKMKTNVKLAMDDSDHTIAELMTDGCNMGVKALSRYLNQYKAAEEFSKDVAKRLIHAEEQLAVELRAYL